MAKCSFSHNLEPGLYTVTYINFVFVLGSVSDAVFNSPEAVGLAIIISNDYTSTRHSELPGTQIDAIKMKDTFARLKYATVCRHNIKTLELNSLLVEASRNVHYPPNYKRIVFVFAGHGNHNNCLFMQDGKETHVKSIIKFFLPIEAQHLAHIPKLFFIDACRGDSIDPGCIAGCHVSCKSRGGEPLTNLLLPSKGNYLLAYSTTSGYQSYEMKDKGGMWLRILAENLRASRKSVLDVLTEVNRALIETYQDASHDCIYIQQPELYSTLNETVSFLVEAEDLALGNAFMKSTCANTFLFRR